MVKQVLIDRVSAFVNSEMDEWYRANGVVLVLAGPKHSQLNLCERISWQCLKQQCGTLGSSQPLACGAEECCLCEEPGVL